MAIAAGVGVLGGTAAVLSPMALAEGNTKTRGKAKAAHKTLSLPQLPAKADALFFSEGSIRIKEGIVTSDKPMQVVSRKTITVLPEGGLYIGTTRPGLPKGAKISLVKPLK